LSTARPWSIAAANRGTISSGSTSWIQTKREPPGHGFTTAHWRRRSDDIRMSAASRARSCLRAGRHGSGVVQPVPGFAEAEPVGVQLEPSATVGVGLVNQSERDAVVEHSKRPDRDVIDGAVGQLVE
jgi:hypothetical protein